MNYLVYNAKLIEEEEFKLSADNRAFMYGDGLFESIVVKNKNILFAEDHFERLLSGITALDMEIPIEFNFSFFSNNILKLVNKNPEEIIRIKFQIWRTPGGLYTPLNNTFDFLISASKFTASPEIKERVAFYDDILLSHSIISKYKTLNALPYIMNL